MACSFICAPRKMVYEENEITLTKSEYDICEYLALNHGQVFSKERIYEQVFGFDGESDSSAITEHVKNIRAKCSRFGLEPIETVWGIGYRWKYCHSVFSADICFGRSICKKVKNPTA